MQHPPLALNTALPQSSVQLEKPEHDARGPNAQDTGSVLCKELLSNMPPAFRVLYEKGNCTKTKDWLSLTLQIKNELKTLFLHGYPVFYDSTKAQSRAKI